MSCDFGWRQFGGARQRSDSEVGARYNSERGSDPDMIKGIAAAERKAIGAIFPNCDQQSVIAQDIDAFIHLGNHEVRTDASRNNRLVKS
jgi:hypothetical protein